MEPAVRTQGVANTGPETPVPVCGTLEVGALGATRAAWFWPYLHRASSLITTRASPRVPADIQGSFWFAFKGSTAVQGAVLIVAVVLSGQVEKYIPGMILAVTTVIAVLLWKVYLGQLDLLHSLEQVEITSQTCATSATFESSSSGLHPSESSTHGTHRTADS